MPIKKPHIEFSHYARKKKKILFMVQLPPPVHGAALRNESLAKSKLLNENFAIRTLSLHFVDTIDDIGSYSYRKLLRLMNVYFNFLYESIFHRPDLAYFTITPAGGAFFRDAIFALTLKALGIKPVYHLRGLGVRESSMRTRFSSFVYKRVYNGVIVICIGKTQINDLNHLPVGKFFVVPDGLENEVEDWEIVKTIASGKLLTILYLSNFVKSKGVYDFLYTLRKLADDDIDFRARMIGAPADTTAAQLRQCADELGITDRVLIEPPVFGKMKFKAFMDCDIFCFPTYFDLFPGVVLEAMQCGRPILTTRTGCIPEIIDDGVNGILAVPQSTDDIAKKLKLLVNNEEMRTKLGLNARTKYLNEFTLSRYEKRMKEVFDQC